jgi:3-oxoadipate enol-lactonase
MPRWSTGAFEIDGERIYYESVGAGDPVVLCHGLGGNHASWWRVVPALAEQQRVVTWDQRGFGNSTRRSGRYGPEQAVGDLLGLLDHLGLDRVQLVGQSMGGWVAMGFALAQKDRLRSLVLTDTLAGVSTPEIADALRAVGARRSGAPGEVGDHPALGEGFRRDRPDLAFLYQEISSMGDKADDAEMLALIGAMRAPLDQVEQIGVPVLLVVGQADQLCPPAAMALIADRIPGAEFEVVAGAGHSPYFERPEEWSRIVGDFLGRHRSP